MVGKYQTPDRFRASLEQRLKNRAIQERRDLQRLRVSVAFDRFLARVCHEHQTQWALKGGYAMELQFTGARATKDLDLTLTGKRSELDIGDQAIVRQLLQNALSDNRLDFFQFLVGEPMDDLEGAPYGGARFPITARLAGRIFAEFHVDVGAGDLILLPTQSTEAKDQLGFADIPAPTLRVISKEQQFAEKIHAYTLPRERQNSRAKDLVDLFLLVESGQMDIHRVREALAGTFNWRGTHALPHRLERPPEDWAPRFEAYMQESGRNGTVTEAYSTVEAYFRAVQNED